MRRAIVEYLYFLSCNFCVRSREEGNQGIRKGESANEQEMIIRLKQSTSTYLYALPKVPGPDDVWGQVEFHTIERGESCGVCGGCGVSVAIRWVLG